MNKQELINRLAELQEEIEKVKAEIDKPEIDKPEKWNPSGDRRWYFDLSGVSHKSIVPEMPEYFINFGLFCKTEADAKELAIMVRSLARQYQWFKENDDGWVADWNDSGQIKYYLFYNVSSMSWLIGTKRGEKIQGVIYMSLPNAEKLVSVLNSGEVEL